MKPATLLLASLLLTTSIFAQEQVGLVREQNSNRKVIAGVQVIFTDAIPTTSDNNGVFTLSFSGKKEGDLIFYEEIRKRGYEIVNKKELEVLKIGRTNQLGTDLILARVGLVDAAKKAYYEVSDDALIAGLNKEKKALWAKLQAAQLGQENYLSQLSSLQEQYDRQKQSLDVLAAKFSRINFDDVAPIYQEALELFKAGKVSQAITALESANPAEQTKKIIAEEKRLIGARTDLDAQKAELATQKTQQIATVRLLADMFNVNFEPEKAEDQYDQLLSLDSSSLEILAESADFYRVQHRYEKAGKIYAKIIAHPAAEDWEVATAYGQLGGLYTTTGKLVTALKAYKLCFESYDALHREKPSSFYKTNLAVSYEKLGATHVALGHLDTALVFYQQYNGLAAALSETHPNDAGLKNILAISNTKMGEIHEALGHLDTALVFYSERARLGKELCAAYPDNVEFKNGLAISYLKLGSTYAARGNLKTALTFYQQYSALVSELSETYPNNVSFKNSLAISYTKLGETHADLGHLDTALTFYTDQTALFEELHEAYPNNISFKNGLAVSYYKLGTVSRELNELKQCAKYLKAAEQLWIELVRDAPQYLQFQRFLGIVRREIMELD
jgi:tetratricopeptide (TPR) repeat protein